jgi:hypothetical protein
MRCLKRYIAREVYNSLRADLADTAQPRPTVSTTIICATPVSESTEPAPDIYKNISAWLSA